MIFDFHVHVPFKSEGKRFTAQELVDAMDMAGVGMALLLGNDQGDMGYKRPWVQNIPDPYARTVGKLLMTVASNFSDEEVAEYCQQFPNRLMGSTSVHPSRYRPEEKVKRAITEFGLRAVKVYPHSGFYPNDQRLYNTYRFCADFNIPVIFHTGIKAQRYHYLKFNNPVFIDDIATDFPDLKVVMCHSGYPFYREFLTVAYSNPNVWVDITFMNYIESTFQETGYTEKFLSRLKALIGAERLIWGSEGPFMNIPLYGKHGGSEYAELQNVLVNRFDFLSAYEKARILGENASKLLGIADQ